MNSPTATLIVLGLVAIFGLIVLPLLIRRRRQPAPWEAWETESAKQRRALREQEERALATNLGLTAKQASRLHHLAEIASPRQSLSGVEGENDYERVLARHPHGGYPHFHPQPHPGTQNRSARRLEGSGGRRQQDQDSRAQDAGALAATGFLMAQAGSGDDAGHGHSHTHDAGGGHGSDAGSSGGDGGSFGGDCGGCDAGGGF